MLNSLTSSSLETVLNFLFKHARQDFSGAPGVKSPPSNAEDSGMIPGQGTNFPHATEFKSKQHNYGAHTP